MSEPRLVPADHSAFAGLPVFMISVGRRLGAIAVHVAGRLSSGRVPVICLADYHRNMADFTDFVPGFQALVGKDWPLVLIDLAGRGRSLDRHSPDDYGSLADAQDVITVTQALGIERAILLGQGHGGHVIMALASQRPTLLAGTTLIDAGPATTPESVMRLRNNLNHIAELRGQTGLHTAFRKMLGAEYPGLGGIELDRLATRTHYIPQNDRAQALFDSALVKFLDRFAPDDVLKVQWPLFEALGGHPLLLMRTELTEHLSLAMVEEMARRRPDANLVTIARQGSPALLAEASNIEPIAELVRQTPAN